LVVNASDRYCQFTEELFRIFVSLLVLDQEELEQQRHEKRLRKELADRRYYQDMAYESIEDAKVQWTLNAIGQSSFDADWDREDHSHLLKFT
jgi:hypothetical protein